MLKFTNSFPETVWVCIDWYHPNCSDGGDWEKAGWWKIDPGQSAVASTADVSDVNQFWYYFAHSAGGSVWAGPFAEMVPHSRFAWCENTSSTDARQVGMRELDVGNADNYIVNLAA